jgi:hypothetical protein
VLQTSVLYRQGVDVFLSDHRLACRLQTRRSTLAKLEVRRQKSNDSSILHFDFLLLPSKIMLHKCANPPCSSLFRKMSEGRLFQMPRRCSEGSKREPRFGARRAEYFWLCDRCAPFFTLQFDPASGVVPVPRTRLNFAAARKQEEVPATRGHATFGELRWNA